MSNANPRGLHNRRRAHTSPPSLILGGKASGQSVTLCFDIFLFVVARWTLERGKVRRDAFSLGLHEACPRNYAGRNSTETPAWTRTAWTGNCSRWGRYGAWTGPAMGWKAFAH